jgi:hypothetical protein
MIAAAGFPAAVFVAVKIRRSCNSRISPSKPAPYAPLASPSPQIECALDCVNTMNSNGKLQNNTSGCAEIGLSPIPPATHLQVTRIE